MKTNEQPPSATAKPLAQAQGSAWQQVNAVFAEADKLEELIQIRLEAPGETRAGAMAWAKEMYQRYSPNTKVSHGGDE